MDAGLLYQNAKIKSKESELFTRDKMQRLSDAVTAEEALRILQENGYPAGTDPVEVLAAAEREATLFYKSAVVSGYGLELFLLPLDYHNAKVLAKKAYFLGNADCLGPDGLTEAKVIEESLEKEDFSQLPACMTDAFRAIRKKSADESLTPSYIDVALDKALFAAIQAGLPDAHAVVKEYFVRLSDLTNITVACRAKKAGISASAFAEMTVAAGEISTSDIRKIFELGAEEAAEKLTLPAVYKDALRAMKEGTAHFETYVDDTLLAPIRKARYDMFSPAAIVGFYLGKLREIKNVRLILAKINNGVDREVIKVRTRELYV